MNILDLENVKLAEFKEILEEKGYFYVKFKTVPIEGNVFDQNEQSEGLTENKTTSNALPRGFIPKESGSTKVEEKKIFSYGKDMEFINLLTSKNNWPPGFNHSSHDLYFSQVSQLAKIITGLISQIYTGHAHTWLDLCDRGEEISIMRIFEYEAREEALGSSEHTDWGFLTIIKATEIVPGLQVFDKNEWIANNSS